MEGKYLSRLALKTLQNTGRKGENTCLITKYSIYSPFPVTLDRLGNRHPEPYFCQIQPPPETKNAVMCAVGRVALNLVETGNERRYIMSVSGNLHGEYGEWQNTRMAILTSDMELSDHRVPLRSTGTGTS